MKTKLFRKGDIAVIAVILIIAAAFYFYKLNDSDKLEAIISVNRETIETIDLSAEKEKQSLCRFEVKKLRCLCLSSFSSV